VRGVTPETVSAASTSLFADLRTQVVAGELVRLLARQGGVALARLWLAEPGDVCGSCPARAECPDQTRCLHLAASAGASLRGGEPWERIDGAFRRVPLGVGKVGKVGASGSGMLLHDMSERSAWIVHPEWARREGLRSFAAQPLVARKEVLGVVAVFGRTRIDAPAFERLRAVADVAASAVAAARDLEEGARQRARLEHEIALLRADLQRAAGADEAIGSSDAWRNVLAQIELLAASDAPVLVQGEAGTGKEVVARRIHGGSRRAGGPFVVGDCAGQPPARVDEELFGSASGPGRLAAAEHGTVFLDEVSALPQGAQARLLAWLRARAGDVRVVAATSRDPRSEVEAGRMERDLYHALAVFTITLPPLRERVGDLGALAEHFVRRAAARSGRPFAGPSTRELRALERYPWPGNVRELASVIEHAVRIGQLDLEPLRRAALALAPGASDDVISAAEWRQRERANLEAALRRSGGRIYGKDGAAALIGVPPTTFASRMRALAVASPGRPRSGP
jgi:transcriptional regulator with GAF, ATPase, and Fis domain